MVVFWAVVVALGVGIGVATAALGGVPSTTVTGTVVAKQQFATSNGTCWQLTVETRTSHMVGRVPFPDSETTTTCVDPATYDAQPVGGSFTFTP